MKPFIVLLVILCCTQCDAFGERNVTKETCKSCASQIFDPQLNMSCFWCSTSQNCDCGNPNDTELSLGECEAGWCEGESCRCDDCTQEIFPCSGTAVGQLFLMFFYGCILAGGAKLIGDGSELLLEIMNPGIIGALVLPILGAVPDAAIIIMSGLSGTAEEAQENLGIGVGTLAGSTIMLLTIPWSFSLLLGRCDIIADEAVDKRVSKFSAKSFTNSGVTVNDDTPVNAKVMIMTSASYLIVQGVAFFYLADPTGDAAKKMESYFALAGFIVCSFCLVGYCAYQLMNPKLQQAKIDNAREQAILASVINSMSRSMATASPTRAANGGEEEKASLVQADVRGVGLKWKAKAKRQAEESNDNVNIQDDEEEVEGTTFQIAVRAATLLFIGTAVVSFFSDPMVSVIGNFGNTINVNVFYVSFIVTPVCSNASELISSLMFAAKKKRKNTSLTYSQIYGAATMNNSLCLGIFFGLIYFRGLSWTFSAETVTILFVTLAVGIPGSLKTTFKLVWMFFGLALYPLSIALVAVLEMDPINWT